MRDNADTALWIMLGLAIFFIALLVLTFFTT